MTYREVLIHRHRQIMAAPPDAGVMDYLALRNRDALQAWRERFLIQGMHPTSARQGTAAADQNRL
jgi:hypothetical protein